MEEIWKDAVGYEGLYQVSNFGRVQSLDRRDIRNRFWKGKILSQQVEKLGYCSVKLCKNGIQKREKVHRLVALAFVENPNNYKEINHKDENKQNNRSENLEWCTRQYNVTYGRLDQEFRWRRIAGERCGRHKLTLQQVNEIREKYIYGSKESNIFMLSKEYGVSLSQIGNIVRECSWRPEYI